MTEKTEECKICSAEGIAIVFKDNRGLAAHLRTKHNEMKLDEYREKYGEKVEEEISETEESTNSSEVVIIDYKLLNNSNLSAMFVDENGTISTFRKVIAIGNIEIENSSVISAMIIGDDGLLTPTFIVPGFARIVERDTNELIQQKTQKKKTKFSFKFLKRKRMKIPAYERKPNENLSQELITQFSKHLQNKKFEEEH